MRALLRFFNHRGRAALLLGLLLSPTLLYAQARGQEPGTVQAPDAQHPGHRPGVRLMRRLNLTPEQRLRLREIRQQSDPLARELARRMRLARRALDEAIYADALDEALVEQRTRELAAAQAELVRLRAKNELSVRRVLTPEQLQSFRELRGEAQRQQLLRRRLRGANRRHAAGLPSPDATDADAQAEDAERRRDGPPAGADAARKW